MKLSAFSALTVGAATMAASLVTASNDGTCNYYCSAECLSYGDPHFVDFHGDIFHTDKGLTEVTFYATEEGDYRAYGPVTNVTVPGDSAVFQLFYDIYLGDVHISAEDFCQGTTDGPIQSYTHTFKNGDLLEANVWCATSPTYPNQLGYFLNANFTKTDLTDDSTADFFSIESELGSSGQCFGKGNRRALRGRETQSSCAWMCAPSSNCTGVNDPHVTDFWTDLYTLKPPGPLNYTAYSMPQEDAEAFEVIVVTKNDGRTYGMLFGDTYVSTENCTNGAKTLPINLKQTFSNGDIVRAGLVCHKSDSHNEYGIMFNWSVVKWDASSDTTSTFREIEEDEGTTGLCIAPPAQ